MNKITIMGRNGEGAIESAARGIQWLCGDSNTIYMDDVKTMVVRVIAQADGDKINYLQIADHGNDSGCLFGRDWITTNNFDNFGSYLAKLQPHFTKDAKVHLSHCLMGKNTDLMFLFAATLNVKVYAGTGADAAAPYNFNFGEYVGVTPQGTVFKEMHRP
jgi:hypothetical protein